MGLGREAEALEFGAKLNAIKAKRGQQNWAELRRNKLQGRQGATPPPAPERPPPLGWGSLTTPPLMPKVTLPQLPPNYYSSSTSPVLRFETSTQIPRPSSSPAATAAPATAEQAAEAPTAAAGAAEEREEWRRDEGKPVLGLRGFVSRKEAVKCF